ncbi:MAG TPA: transcription factor S [archaeon]|nr:transcription factor S [archaeon]
MKKTKKIRKEKRQKKQKKSEPTGGIDFCAKCGAIMIPEKKSKHIYLKCRKCGAEKKKDIKCLKISEEKKHTKGIVVIEGDSNILPLTDKSCPKCEHTRAHWWLQQTRSADEPPTQFFRCEKCRHTWREYK